MGRIFGFLSVIITLAIGMYIYSQQVKNLAPGPGTGNPVEIANVTGVKGDLIGIANAERSYMAAQGKYATLDELISGNYIIIKSERPPYVYAVETTSSGFRVTATRTTQGAPAQLWITENMEMQSE